MLKSRRLISTARTAGYSMISAYTANPGATNASPAQRDRRVPAGPERRRRDGANEVVVIGRWSASSSASSSRSWSPSWAASRPTRRGGPDGTRHCSIDVFGGGDSAVVLGEEGVDLLGRTVEGLLHRRVTPEGELRLSLEHLVDLRPACDLGAPGGSRPPPASGGGAGPTPAGRRRRRSSRGCS